MASLDLKVVFFQVPVHKAFQKYLHFVCQFKVLCFGLSTAPKVFTRTFTALSSLAHSSGIRLLRYLNGWLIRALSKNQLKRDLERLLFICSGLGIVVNQTKSELIPTQQVTYMGMFVYLWEQESFRPNLESTSSGIWQIPSSIRKLLQPTSLKFIWDTYRP